MFPFIVCILNNRQCGACIDIPGCRFDLDSMLCMKEDDGDSSKSESTQWALDSSSCPELDDCGYTLCSTCAQYGCTWCDSLNRCMDESDTVYDAFCSRKYLRKYLQIHFIAFMTFHIKSLEYNQIGRKKYVCDTIHAFVSPVVVHCELRPKAAGLIYHPSYSNSLTNT